MGWGRVAQILAELLQLIVQAVQSARSIARRDAVHRDGSGSFMRAFSKPTTKASIGERKSGS